MSSGPGGHAAGPVGLRILVADDFRDSAESLAVLLRLLGNEVQVAHDGLEAVAAAERFRPDLVLLDLRMPRMDGFEACRRIRSASQDARVLLIAQTGLEREEDEPRIREAGFDGQLSKPVDPAALLQLFARLSSRR